MKPKTNRNFKELLSQITITINTVKFIVCVFFLFNNDLFKITVADEGELFASH